MFWEKGYTPSQNIEALLEKEDVTVEEFLDDDDLLQECKSQKKNLVHYLTRPDVIKRLLELITSEPPEDLPIAQRFRHASVACEILTLGLPSLNEKIVEDPTMLKTLYSYLEQEPPLNPLLASFFNKTFGMLIWKKYDLDWFLYQKMCLQVLEFIKAQGNFLDLIFKHFATPVIMDLLFHIIKEVQGGTLKKDLYEWLTEQKLVERLIYMLGQPEECEKHKNIAEFICELIKHGRSLRQTEQDNDGLTSAFTGSNPLLLSIENETALTALLDVMLRPNTNESTIVAGILIVLTLVDESIVDEPASDKALQIILDREKENREKIVSTVIKVTAPRLRDFHELILNPPNNREVITAAAKLNPPFGYTRLQICRLFTVLLQTGNKEIMEKICEIDYFNTLLKHFKQYVWNNFLHSEVEKCFQYVFATFDQTDDKKVPSALQTFVIVNCKIIPKLIGCWMENNEMQSSKCGRRLGYMGHLIKILKHVTSSMIESDYIGALIQSNLDEQELANWKLITDVTDGELPKQLNEQTRMLANCNAYESAENFTEYCNNPGIGIIIEDSDINKLLENSAVDLCSIIEHWNLNQLANGIAEDVSLLQVDSFADFDAHFSSYSSDLGDDKFIVEKSDNNANVEKFPFDGSTEDDELNMKNAKNKEGDNFFDITNDPWQVKETASNENPFFINKSSFDDWGDDFAELRNQSKQTESDVRLTNGPIEEPPQQTLQESCNFIDEVKPDRLSGEKPSETVYQTESTKVDNIPEFDPLLNDIQVLTSAAIVAPTESVVAAENGPA